MPASIPPEPRRSRDELLADVQRRGRVLRRRRKVLATMSALAVTALVFGLVGQLTSRHSGVQVTTAGQGQVAGPAPDATAPTTSAGGFTTTTSGPARDQASSTTTTTASPEMSSVSRRPGTPLSTTTSSTMPASWTTSTTSPPTATTNTTTPSTTTTTQLVCWKSYDPRCGDFHWDPTPTVDPLTASASVLTASPKAGQPVLFKLVADDPDTTVSPCAPATYDDGSLDGVCNGGTYACRDDKSATGAWPPPDKQPGHWESNETYTHTYVKPGTYTATFYFFTGYPGCPSPWDKDPYRNTTTAKVTFTVEP